MLKTYFRFWKNLTPLVTSSQGGKTLGLVNSQNSGWLMVYCVNKTNQIFDAVPVFAAGSERMKR